MFYDNTVFPSRPVHESEFKYLTELSDEAADRHAKTCKAKRRAHIQSDIAASEARAQGLATQNVVHAAVSAWRREYRDPTQSHMLKSAGLADWSLSSQVMELVYAERRRGHVEGLVV